MAAPGIRVCSPFFAGWSCGAEYAFARFAINYSFLYDFAQRNTKRMSSRSFADYLEMKLLRDKMSAFARQIQHPDASICLMRLQKMGRGELVRPHPSKSSSQTHCTNIQTDVVLVSGRKLFYGLAL